MISSFLASIFMMNIFNTTTPHLKGAIVFSTQSSLNIIHLDKKESWKSPKTISLGRKKMCWNPEWISVDTVAYRAKQLDSEKHYLVEYHIYTGEEEDLLSSDNPDKPSLSPDKSRLAFSANQWLANKSKALRWLVLFDRMTRNRTDYRNIHLAQRQTFSWSKDGKRIVLVLEGGEIGILSLATGELQIVSKKGIDPIFNPKTGSLFFVQDGKLVEIENIREEAPIKIIAEEWGWRIPFNFSKDGMYLFYIGGGNFLGSEYSTIEYLNLETLDAKRISKKYPIIHGASYTGDIK